MIEVYKDLYIGSGKDLIDTNKDWYIVHAGKEPWHRNAVGYTCRALPKDHEEYLFAIRDKELSLNIIDGSKYYYCNTVFDEAFKFIDNAEGKILVHCNQGQSRSPSIVFLYMASKGWLSNDFIEAKKEFIKLYPFWNPKGIIEWVEEHWDEYVK